MAKDPVCGMAVDENTPVATTNYNDVLPCCSHPDEILDKAKKHRDPQESF